MLDKMDAIFAGCNTSYLMNDSFVTDALEPYMTGVDERQYAVVVHAQPEKQPSRFERIARPGVRAMRSSSLLGAG
ncbi:MAG: hypothetical protein ACSLEN_14565 [Candidatus Malihini olakiniferum]